LSDLPEYVLENFSIVADRQKQIIAEIRKNRKRGPPV